MLRVTVNMDSFYVHLQSDASKLHFSDNIRTNFRNHLAIPIKTDSTRYEVALSEISYTYNSPYIKKGTLLYTLKQPTTPKNDVVKYPNYSEIKGDNYKTTVETFDTDLVEKSRSMHRHIDHIQQLWGKTLFSTTSRKVTLQKATIDIIASKELKTIETLIHELNEKLQPLNIVFSLTLPTKATKKLTIKHKAPEFIANQHLLFSEKIKTLFQHGEWDASLSYVSDGYEHDSFPLTTPFLIKKGEKLLTVSFWISEIHIVSQVATPVGWKVNAQSQLASKECIASKDIRTVQELIKEMSVVDGVELALEDTVASISILPPVDLEPILNERISAILGLTLPSRIPSGYKLEKKGKSQTVFELGVRKIYIYTDIIHEQRVGDQVAPLLRMIDYTGEEGRVVIKDFNNLHYISLNKDDIQTIRIYLRTEIGEEVPVTFGTVSCTLHFREKQL